MGVGTYSIIPLVRPASTDGVVGFGGSVISSTTIFNAATVNAVPEPGTLALVGLGVSGLGLLGRRHREAPQEPGGELANDTSPRFVAESAANRRNKPRLWTNVR